MYIYQNGKLYVQRDAKLIGVEIYPDKGVFEVEGTETELGSDYEPCTSYEARCRFQISPEHPYIFPKEVTTNEPVKPVQRTRKPRGK